ncbi:MAG: hypothetical protein ACR2PZ_14575 [Pseudomonadales bacterium]
MNTLKDNILATVCAAVTELNEELEYEHLNQPQPNTVLYDGDNALDSLSLVTLIVDIETRIADEFEQEVLLASEKAMSMRNSPYRSVAALVEFIDEELKSLAMSAGSVQHG